MKRLLISLIGMAMLSAITSCNPSQQIETKTIASETPIRPTKTVYISITNMPRPVATMTPMDTHTPTPSATAPATPTSIPLPTSTPSRTPTATPNRVVPGIYAGTCTKYRVGYFLNVDFCVDQVQIFNDYSMDYSLSWTFHLPFEPGGYFEPYFFYPNERKMYVIDNLGKKYGPLEAKYNIADFYAKEGDVMTAILSFSSAQPGARIFTFYDEAHDTSMTIALTTPLHIYDYLALTHSPFSLRYQIKYWQVSKSTDGEDVLTHLTINKCVISEAYPSTPQGTLINNLKIGSITYNIYRYYGQEISVREYQAVAGIDGIDPNSPPLISVTIPLDNSQQCILDASEVLAHLQPAEPVNP